MEVLVEPAYPLHQELGLVMVLPICTNSLRILRGGNTIIIILLMVLIMYFALR